MYVSVLVLDDGRRVARYVQAASDQVVVTEARGLDDDLRQQAGVACRRQQQVEHVTAARGVLDVLHHIVAVQQVVQAGVQWLPLPGQLKSPHKTNRCLAVTSWSRMSASWSQNSRVTALGGR